MDVKYIDPSYMIRSIPTITTDRIYCKVLGQGAVHGAFAGDAPRTAARCAALYCSRCTAVAPDPLPGPGWPGSPPACALKSSTAPPWPLWVYVYASLALYGSLAGYTDFTVGLVNTHYVFLPTTTIIQSVRTVDPYGKARGPPGCRARLVLPRTAATVGFVQEWWRRRGAHSGVCRLAGPAGRK